MMTQAAASNGDLSRADRRRAQVLAAAATCFNRDGFHGASMASIAHEAHLSVGQIYRYFENKEAIIVAIVEQSLAEWSQRMADVRAKGDLVEEMLEVARYHVDKVEGREQAALSLEFFAEAARNPRIGEIVRVMDRAMRAHLRDILLRNASGEQDGVEARIDMIFMLVDGWSVRAVKNPGLNKEEYLSALRPLFEILLSCSSNGDCV
ncbi:MAG: TetR/AcrR family transcriptional regulator [Caulobacterales bacterium]